MSIRLLPPSVVNKIAAGEVIERPASVLKELVENSLDAGATRIEVAVEQGGMELIRVADDGAGIAADELVLAVSSHATSKLGSADDLFHVRTLGFRGEALASIAEVSHFMLRSRPAAAAAGAQLEVLGGEIKPAEPAASPPGTCVEVRNLFFNTPVRRKFLRSTQTEMGHATEALARLALAHPSVYFSLRHNGRVVHELPPAADQLGRVGLFFGQDLADDLLWVESRDDDTHLSGFVARPSQSRSHPRMQYLFLNGRHIRDRSLQHALAEAYRGLLLTGRYPICFLNLEMPAELVDVNVHPTKLEVRFQNGGRIYSQLLATLRTRFLSTDLTHRLDPGGGDARGAAEPLENDDPRRAARLESELVHWAKEQLAAQRSAAGGPALEAQSAVALAPTGRSESGAAARQPHLDFKPLPAAPALDLTRISRTWTAEENDEQPVAELSVAPLDRTIAASAAPHPALDEPVRALQVHDRYLVAESAEGVLVIDQHALHERILYEQIRGKVLAGVLETQKLLIPEAVDLTAAEAALVLEHRPLLARLGVDVEPFGGGTVLVSSYPAMLGRLSPGEVLRALAEQLASGGREPERRDMLDELLHMISCKAAIKAGDRLSDEEVIALVQQRHLAQDTHHCPHGRPTALVFTRDELDKQFKRL